MAPVLIKNRFKFLAVPVNEKWLGAHKTWRGFIFGVLTGELIYLFQYFFNPEVLSLFNYQEYSWAWGFLLGFGALAGDAIKSFFKRRLNIKPGRPWIPFDQIDYALGALIVASFIFPLTWQIWLIIILSGIILHSLSNLIGYALKIKDVPW